MLHNIYLVNLAKQVPIYEKKFGSLEKDAGIFSISFSITEDLLSKLGALETIDTEQYKIYLRKLNPSIGLVCVFSKEDSEEKIKSFLDKVASELSNIIPPDVEFLPDEVKKLLEAKISQHLPVKVEHIPILKTPIEEIPVKNAAERKMLEMCNGLNTTSKIAKTLNITPVHVVITLQKYARYVEYVTKTIRGDFT
ncbi:MAG: hypothetical protein B6U95_00395 [Thermofilum sp. ex4484_82]|nr:MAG: hypothetical protein B6U95_00395 [Thermofilum sp. ex4484_82]OYT40075.1 MAG: hypothetical protein B6U96_00400 [Archaeoglobales archaeon ex4484_92]